LREAKEGKEGEREKDKRPDMEKEREREREKRGGCEEKEEEEAARGEEEEERRMRQRERKRIGRVERVRGHGSYGIALTFDLIPFQFLSRPLPSVPRAPTLLGGRVGCKTLATKPRAASVRKNTRERKRERERE